MTLPIDPSKVTESDVGTKRAVLEMDHDAAVEHVREAFVDAGFGVATEFSPSEMLNEKVDADRDPYYVLGACNPSVANEALDVTKDMGGLFPCNVVVWQDEPGVQHVYHVSIMKIARLVGIAPDTDEWQSIVDETGGYVEAAIANLDGEVLAVDD
jgi:uncharacterized protein (DUF302 family)